MFSRLRLASPLCCTPPARDLLGGRAQNCGLARIIVTSGHLIGPSFLLCGRASHGDVCPVANATTKQNTYKEVQTYTQLGSFVSGCCLQAGVKACENLAQDFSRVVVLTFCADVGQTSFSLKQRKGLHSEGERRPLYVGTAPPTSWLAYLFVEALSRRWE